MGVLFDLDGVLVDSLELHRTVWHDWAQFHGLDPAAVFEATFGRRPLDTINEVAPHLAVESELARLGVLLDEHAGRVRLHDGALSAVEVAGGGPWAIVTSTDRVRCQGTLQRLGCPCPQVVVGADDVVVGKPAPDGYLAAAARLGVDPSGCVVVEDAPAGIEAGRAAGSYVLAVSTTRPAAELAGADVVVDDLAAAIPLLRGWLDSADARATSPRRSAASDGE